MPALLLLTASICSTTVAAAAAAVGASPPLAGAAAEAPSVDVHVVAIASEHDELADDVDLLKRAEVCSVLRDMAV